MAGKQEKSSINIRKKDNTSTKNIYKLICISVIWRFDLLFKDYLRKCRVVVNGEDKSE